MKRLILILILTLSFQSIAKSDDIRDFEIEGMSIGDSLLDYFTKQNIESERSFYRLGGKYLDGYSKISIKKNNKIYDNVVLYFESDDKRYTIQAISGRNYYNQNVDECYKTQKIIVNELKMIMDSSKIKIGKKNKHSRLPNSYVTSTYFYLNDSDITISCYDFSKKDTQSKDRLSVIVRTEKLNIYLRSTK